MVKELREQLLEKETDIKVALITDVDTISWPRASPYMAVQCYCRIFHVTFKVLKGGAYKWFPWGVTSLSEGKSQGLCLVQLCAKYRLVSATSSPYH